MIWFTWRQFRTQTWITVGFLAVVAVVLAITGLHLADLYSAVAACHTDCGNVTDSFLQEAKAGANGVLYNLAIAVMYVVPAIVGAFWGAPLLARELETGTHRLAWNQSVTRGRWVATKLISIGGASMLTAGLLSLGVSWWADHIDHAANDRITPLLFGARGIVPIAYAAFAFALGITLGMLVRRTLPAMAATLAVYAAAVAAMPLWIRGHLMPARLSSTPLDVDSIRGFGINDQGGSMRVFARDSISGGWTLANKVLTPGGKTFTGPANLQYCNRDGSPRDCLNWVATLNLRQNITYQPASHFWPLQWIEGGIFLAAAALLAGFCFWWTTRRLT